MDICMCMSKNCERREECFRAQATPDRYQTYADFEEICKEDGYKHFWEMEKRGVKRE